MDNLRWSRREFLAAGSPFLFWRQKQLKIGDISFRIVRNGRDRRRFIWIHGNERTARDVLLSHMENAEGRAFLIENNVRNAPIGGGVIDPNRMFSRAGAEQNLRRLNPGWNEAQLASALVRLARDRENFVASILPPDGEVIVALHNNSEGYSVKDEVPISDAVALNDSGHPHEFLLCTVRRDFDVLAGSPFNVVLQNTGPKEDDGSLSRLAAARGVRYVNIEAALGNAGEQTRMLGWVEEHLA